jgi:NAD(P)-dependent dehydrogenase (short-subunit alcohol dehydrogenase family)
VIAAQELQGYGVTVNCVAPNARTRMTEETFELEDAAEGFDPLDPMNVTLVVLALCSEQAGGITGQVLHVWGGAVNVLTGWSPGELLARDGGWTPEDFLDGLLDTFSDGVAPAGMTAGMEAAGGRGLGLV